jgi:hypothetical protein
LYGKMIREPHQYEIYYPGNKRGIRHIFF